MTKPLKHDESELLAEALSEVIRTGSKRRKYKLKTSVKLGLIGTLAGVLLLGGAWFLLSLSRPSPTEVQLRKYKEGARFQLYVPATLPAGYALDENKTVNTGGTIFTTFIHTDSAKPAIVMSQQAVPDGVGIQNLLSLSPPESINTPNGKLYLANTAEDNTAILVTDSSWVIATANKSLNQEALQDFMTKLKALEN